MKLVGQATILSFDPFSSTNNDATATETQSLGEMVNLGDGRVFRYGKAGASNTGAGKLELAPTPKTNHHNCTAIASAAGTLFPTFTLGATAAVADEYDEGFITINVTPDVGRTYRISYMGAIGSAGTATPTLADPIVTAWTTATRVNLIHNQWNNFVETASATKRAAGVGLIGLTAANFGWLQTKGVANTLVDQTLALGSLVGASASVAGAVTVNSGTYATALATTQVGQASVMAGVDTQYQPIVLLID
jgi:hypothetical protein